MKILKFLPCLLLLILSCKNNSEIENKQNVQIRFEENINNSNKNVTQIDLNKVQPSEGVDFLKLFYKKFYFDSNDLSKFKTQNLFLSNELIKKIDSLNSDPDNIILDYDPFIQGQDFDGKSIQNSFKVEFKNNSFYVSFIAFENSNYTVIYDLVKDEKNDIKINNILNDSNFK